MANVLSTAKRVQIVSALVEGVSVRATARMVGVSKDTVMKLGVELGEACARYQDETLRNLSCKRLQIDELWAFCYAKAKNVPAEKAGEFGYGDVWTFTAIDADTKLIPSYMVGPRDGGTATEFMQDLASRCTEERIQITTDGHAMYLSAVEDAFAGRAAYAMLVKVYGAPQEAEKRYSPAECIGCLKQPIQGGPDPAHISTSYVERANLSMRMGLRRYTRLTNAHSKKLENHCAALAIFFMHYNFARIHSTIRCSPAMAAGVTPHLWSIREIVELLPAPVGQKRGPYRPRVSK